MTRVGRRNCVAEATCLTQRSSRQVRMRVNLWELLAIKQGRRVVWQTLDADAAGLHTSQGLSDHLRTSVRAGGHIDPRTLVSGLMSMGSGMRSGP